MDTYHSMDLLVLLPVSTFPSYSLCLLDYGRKLVRGSAARPSKVLDRSFVLSLSHEPKDDQKCLAHFPLHGICFQISAVTSIVVFATLEGE